MQIFKLTITGNKGTYKTTKPGFGITTNKYILFISF